MSECWIIAETRAGTVHRVTDELITAAREIAGDRPVHALLMGHGITDDAGAIPADRVIALDDERLDRYSPDGWAAVIASLAEDRSPSIILGAATARGRDLIPRVAAALGRDMASDVIGLASEGDAIVATRPIYAGKAIATVRIEGTPVIATVRPNSFPPAERDGETTVDPAELPDDYRARAVVAEVERSAGERPDVSEADVIVSGGRGMGGPEHFDILEELADVLGAAVGASRAVVDAGWRPHGDQVGQTGKTVSPSLYIACGISGAVQHLAGMKTSDVIVAINKDPEAPIFSVADYGIVGDVFDVVPALTQAIRELKGDA